MASSAKDSRGALDDAVMVAYGFNPKKDLLKQLLDLNHAVPEREKNGEKVTAPGVPESYPNKAKLITDDCIQPG